MLNNAAIEYKNTPYTFQKGDEGYYSKTYFEVKSDSKYLASSLIELGFVKNDKIAILSEGRINWVTGEFSILQTGCISVPLSIKLLPEEVLFRLNHSESKAILVTRNTFEKIIPIWNKIKANNFKIIYLEENKEALNKIEQSVININKDVFIFNDLISKGKTSYEKNKEALNKIESNIEEDDVVTISYTSGTTGNPKGIMLTHLNYYANSNDALNYFQLPTGFKTLLILPLDHSFAHTVGIYISLLKGIGIYFVDARGGSVNTLKNIPINLKEVSPDFILTVPALTGNFMKKITEAINSKGGFVKWLFNKGMRSGIKINGDGFNKGGFIVKLSNYIPYKLADAIIFKKVRAIFGNDIKFCVGGGALLDIKQQKFFYTLGAPIFQGYGLTEATPIISTNATHTHKLGTSGKILPGVEVKIIETDGSEAPQGKKGEISIKGLNVMSGYYKNPKASSEVIDGKWLKTGDMGYVDEDDYLMVVGREKALLISQDGEKYSPEEIEEAITNSSELILQAMVYNDHKKYTTAIITLDIPNVKSYIRRNNITIKDELINSINNSFYSFKKEKEYINKFPDKWIPSKYIIVENAFSEENKMINSTMKMVRYKITETYQNQLDGMYNSENATKNNNNNIITISKLFFNKT